ncbi:hypothetical protein PV326_002771 [Microctonus aethiopoides]|nr:hypothetical protein PV326_002771 [Microctonus aethiopoides]
MEVIEINGNDTTSLEPNNIDVQVRFHEKMSTSMTYDLFFTQYLLPNRPCVFQSGITDKWPCAQKWRINNAPNFKQLKKLYGDCQVPVANCKVKYYNAQLKNTMSIEKFMDYWQEYKNKNYPGDMPVLYLKDWHCLRDNPNTLIYQVPKFFASDWLNEYYLAHSDLSDDYMFVYMGPKGSWTPLHVDVFKSYSWSANIVGKKRWLLFPPGEENNLYDAYGHLPYDINFSEDNNSVFDHCKNSLEIIQGPGEIVFVPSGWHHQVWNLEDTISINHNWINGCNILDIWKELKKALSAVMKEIEDCCNMDNWLAHCQVVLKASHGMDYSQFYDFISFIIESRLNTINKGISYTSFDTWQLGINHILFDLYRAKLVLNKLINDVKEKDVYDIVFHGNRPEDLVDRVETKLKNI